MKHKFLALFLIIVSFGWSQKPEVAPPPPVVMDSLEVDYYKKGLDVDSLLRKPYSTENEIYPKDFPSQLQDKYKGEDFNYSEIKPKESLWDRIMRSVNRILESLFGKMNANASGNFIKTLLYVVGFIIVAFVLYFLIKYLFDKEGNFIFSKKNKKNQIHVEPLSENIHEINFAQNIEQFETKKEYRLAIRYLFLQTLKQLEDKKLIQWNPEKTNHDYFLEIKKPEHQKMYDQLSYIFDYVWYGEFQINEERYQKLKQQFIQSKFI